MGVAVTRCGANFFGFEYIEGGERRRDPWVVRGNGTVELFEDRLTFSRLVPPRTYTVPINAVTGVEIGQSHNGKFSWPGRVLKVAYQDGARTAILGLLMRKRDAEEWAAEVRRLAESIA